MAERKKRRRRSINEAAVREMREAGMSYPEIAKRFNTSASVIFYTINPRPAKDRPKAVPRRTIYMRDALWFALRDQAIEAEATVSKMLGMILEGKAPLITDVEPDIPGVAGG